MSDKLCSYCVKPVRATWRCGCSNPGCNVFACDKHRSLAENPALIPTVTVSK